MSAEMIYVTEGSVTITVQFHDYIIQKGEVCLIPAGISHSTHKNNHPYKRWLMFINPWLFSRRYSSAELQGMLSGMTYKQPLITTPPDGDNIFESIHDEVTNPKFFSDDISTARVLYLLSLLAREQNTEEQAPISQLLKVVMEVQMYLQENCSLPVRISNVAERFYTNKFYLTHIFKEHTGKSPKQFLIDCRLEKARLLLINSRHNISEISEQCGFASPSDMTKRFREVYGVTPRNYKR